MSKVTILEERPEQLILLKDNNVELVPNTPYTKLKYSQEWDEDRIKYPIDKNHDITETFNNKVFNIEFNRQVIQTRYSLADTVCLLIKQHKQNGNTQQIEEFFMKEFSQFIQDKILDEYLNDREGVKKVTKGYEVNGIFLVGDEGSAYLISTGKHICIVVNGELKTVSIPYQDQMVDLNERTYTILTKINFLLEPNMEDMVFVNQLPKDVIEFYKAREADDGGEING